MKFENIYEEETEVKVGDVVYFKSDIEQAGQVVRLTSNTAVLENLDGFSGDYIGGQTQTVQPLDRLWKEE